MKQNEIERILKEFYKAEEESIIIPNKAKIKAFNAENTVKRRISLKLISAIAACLVLAVASAFIALNYNGSEDISQTSSEAETSKNKETVIAEWYSPRSFSVELTSVTAHGNGASGSANRNIALPDWVTQTVMLNERYIELRYDHHYDNPFYGEGLIVYDLKERTVKSIIGEIFEKNKEFIDSRNPNNRKARDMIVECEFGTNSEWGIFNIWNDACFPIELDQYLINIKSGEMTKLADRRNIIAASKDYKHIVRMRSTEKMIEISVLNTETMTEKVIHSAPQSPSVMSETAEFSKNGRYIIYKTNDQAECTEPSWLIYDTETEETKNGYGNIVSFTEDCLSVIVYENGEHRVLSLDGLEDITGKCNLREYEKHSIFERFEIINPGEKNEKSILKLCREPIFGKEEQKIIASDVHTYIEWNGYYYIYCNGSDKIQIYSITEDESFFYDISDTDISEKQFHAMSIYVLEDGKKCNIVTFFDKHLGNYEIVIGEIKKPIIKEIELPCKVNESIDYESGITIFESPDGAYNLTVTEAYRGNDAIYFNAIDSDYRFYLGAGFTTSGDWFTGLEYCGDESDYDYCMKLTESNDILALNYRREFELELKEDFDSEKGYYSVAIYSVFDKKGNVIKRG